MFALCPQEFFLSKKKFAVFFLPTPFIFVEIRADRSIRTMLSMNFVFNKNLNQKKEVSCCTTMKTGQSCKVALNPQWFFF